MNGTTIRTTLLTLMALAAASGTVATAAAGGDLPAQEPRIWAPTGDLIGLQNHATGSFQVLDDHGNDAKAAEDWQLLGKSSGSLLLGWHRTSATGYRTDLGLYGTNEQGGLTGRFGLAGSKPGHARWALTFRNADHYYDRTSEMRAPAFKYPPPPPTVDPLPHLEWRMLDVDLGYRLGGSFGLRLDFDRMCRQGDKGSLLRSVPGTGPLGPETPGAKVFDTTRNEVRLGADYSGGAFDADLGFAFRAADGERALDTRQARSDDQKVWRVQLNAGYDLGDRTRLLGGVAAANLTDDGSESRAAEGLVDSESKTISGRLGLATRLGRATSLSVVGYLQDLDTDGRFEGGTDILRAVDRQRSRQEVRAEVANTSLKRTRLQLKYRYRQADLDENTAEGDLPGGAAATLNQKVTQDATSHDLVFRGRHRFSRAAQLKIRAGWRSLEVDEATAGDDWLWSMGDRKRERLSWEAAVQTRPGAGLKLDLGARGWDQTFTRAPGDTAQTETSWQASTVFAGLNWNAHARLLVHGTVSWGTEKVDLKGAGDPTGSMGPVAYDGTTFRFIPGVSLRVLRALWLDGMYEGVRFEDTANESANLDALAADHDRMLMRARWEARENLAVAATYRRNEFDENRWDDYIQDIWQLSVSGRF